MEILEDAQYAVSDNENHALWWLTKSGEFRFPALEDRIQDVVRETGAAPELEQRVRAAVLDVIGESVRGLVPWT